MNKKFIITLPPGTTTPTSPENCKLYRNFTNTNTIVEYTNCSGIFTSATVTPGDGICSSDTPYTLSGNGVTLVGDCAV